MKKLYIITLCLLYALSTHGHNMVINVPKASIRTTPKNYTQGQEPSTKASRSMFGPSYELFMKNLSPEFRDPAQSSQALYNEPVICLEKLNNGWLKVRLPEQYEYNAHKKCFGHTVGYIKSKQVIPSTASHKPNIVVTKTWADITVKNGTTLTVPMGTKLYGTKKNSRLHTIILADGRTGTIKSKDMYQLKTNITEPEEYIRGSIIESAQQLIGGHYCWGGRTAACDCSGFVNLVYRSHGLELPRNAHAQWVASKKIKHGSQLKPGDLIFFARPGNKEKVHHVLMYLGDEMVIESAVSRGICISKTINRFDQPVAKLPYGDTMRSPGEHLTEYVIYFGSYINDKKRLDYMRDYALGNYNVTRWVHNDRQRKN